jgi:hypothetical protein
VDRDKILGLVPIKEEKYMNVDLDHLMIYTMGQLYKLNIDLSFENGVVASFRFFPKKFALLGYPEYPDSDRVMNCLNRCVKPKHWLSGKPRQGFILNERSNIYIKEAEDLISGLAQEKSKAFSKTRRKELIFSEIVKSQAYTKYIKGQGSLITESEVCNLLQGTLDSDRKLLKDNLSSLKLFSKELERDEISEFLNWLGNRFRIFLNKG